MVIRAVLVSALLAACDRTPEPVPAGDVAREDDRAGGASADAQDAPGRESRKRAQPDESPQCVVPLAETPPPAVEPAKSCPADPWGRPTMPEASLSFPDSAGAPELTVELALTTEHRTHGLMFRPELSDERGMLFSWPDSDVRSFWMRNTCLALDMLFIDRDGFIAGVVEQVPPMNDAPRSVPCPVKHVLEVPAGWVRRHRVTPGDRVALP